MIVDGVTPVCKRMFIDEPTPSEEAVASADASDEEVPEGEPIPEEPSGEADAPAAAE